MTKSNDLIDYMTNIRKIPGIGQATAENLAELGYENANSLATEKIEILVKKYDELGLRISGRNAGKIIGYAQIYMDKRNKWINKTSSLFDIDPKIAERLFDDGYETFNELADLTNKALKETYGIAYPKDFKDRLSFLVEEADEEIDHILEEPSDEDSTNIDKFYEHHYEPAARKSIAALMDARSEFSSGNIIDLKTLCDYIDEITSPLVKFYSSLYSDVVIDFKRRHIQEQIENEIDGRYILSKSDAITDTDGHVLDFEDWPDSVLGLMEMYNACKDLGCIKNFPIDLAVLIDVASDEMEVQTIVDTLNDMVLSIADEDLPHEDIKIAAIDNLLDSREHFGVPNIEELSKMMKLKDALQPYGIKNEDAIKFVKRIYPIGIKTIEDLKKSNPRVIKSIKGMDEELVNSIYSRINKEK